MKKVKKLKDNKYLSTETIVHGNKLLRNILEKLLNREKILFEGNSNGEITLTENIENHSNIEIFYGASGKRDSVTVCNPIGKSVALKVEYWNDNLLVQVITKLDISANKLTPDLTNCGYTTTSTDMIANATKNNTNYIYIEKVVMYK